MSHDHLEYPSPNWSTRGGHRVRALCIHTTAGAWPSDRDYLCNPTPLNGRPVSAHHIVAPDGVAYQLVDEAHAAWGNGILDKPNMAIPLVAEWKATPQPPGLVGLPNLETVSIEVSALMGARWTTPQRTRVIELGRDICRRHGMRVVLRHSDITNTACPGLTAATWTSIRQMIEEAQAGNPWWPQIGPGLAAAIRQRGDEPMSKERYIKDADGQDAISIVAGRQRGYIWWPDSKRVTVISYDPLAPPG